MSRTIDLKKTSNITNILNLIPEFVKRFPEDKYNHNAIILLDTINCDIHSLLNASTLYIIDFFILFKRIEDDLTKLASILLINTKDYDGIHLCFDLIIKMLAREFNETYLA